MGNIEIAAQRISEADAILITAGAGMGVDSGLPDFRGNQGFWNAYPPMRKAGLSFYEMANPIQFSKNPKRAWGFYGHRFNLYEKTKPHTGFYQLLEISEKKKGKYFVFTSNVDGQFQKAGYDPKRIMECHGSIRHLQCTIPCSSKIRRADNLSVKVDEYNFEAFDPLPRCPDCGALARPNILMFDDWNWVSGRTERQNARLEQWFKENLQNSRKLAVIEIGAGTSVAAVRSTSEHIVSEYNASLIRINPRDYKTPRGQIGIPLSAKTGIEQLYRLLNG
jgi:NAD-dependent SIR2 family protein deacetylase